MKRRIPILLASALLAVSACSDNQLAPAPVATAPSAAASRSNTPAVITANLPPACANPRLASAAIDVLIPLTFKPGDRRILQALSYNLSIQLAKKQGKTQLVQTYIDKLINFTLQTYYAGYLYGGQSAATQDRVLKLIYLLYCANGISPVPDLSGIFGATNTVLVRNATPDTVVKAPGSDAGVKIDSGSVPTSVFGTFVSVVKTSNPLPTSLDWYGADGYKAGAYEFVATPAVEFTEPVLTGVCINYDDDIVHSPSDLRLAHKVPDGYTPDTRLPDNYVFSSGPDSTIEIGAQISTAPLGLSCAPLEIGSNSIFGRLLQQFAQLVLPPPLLAGTKGGSTGSQVVKFSPFAVVDTKLNLTSSGPTSPQVITGGSANFPVTVTVKTRNGGTPIDGIPVTFTPSFSPGVVATNAAGTAASTWTIGVGANSGTATPQKDPLTFDPGYASFDVTGVNPPPTFDWGAAGWGYKSLGAYSHSVAPSGSAISAAVSSSAGYSGPVQGAFGTSGCTYSGLLGSGASAFPLNSVVAFRRDFTVAAGADTGTIFLAIDNDFKIFVNDADVTSTAQFVGGGSSSGYNSGATFTAAGTPPGFVNHDGCANRYDFKVHLSGLSATGNTVVVIALDRGVDAFFDASLVPPVVIP